jgi:hypothetical protein
MGHDLKIKTELTVHEMAENLKKYSDIKELHEIDSINYGDGYDFILNKVSCRLYNDEDSDNGLIIEIDRHDNSAKTEQKEVTDLLTQLTANM